MPVNIRNRFGAIKTELKSVFIIKAGGRCRSRAVENRRKILDLKVRENARHDLCLIKENNCFDSFHLHLFLALCVCCVFNDGCLSSPSAVWCSAFSSSPYTINESEQLFPMRPLGEMNCSSVLRACGFTTRLTCWS